MTAGPATGARAEKRRRGRDREIVFRIKLRLRPADDVVNEGRALFLLVPIPIMQEYRRRIDATWGRNLRIISLNYTL